MSTEHSASETAVGLSFRVIPRAEHAVSRKNISAAALRVLYRLHENGYRACLVGGAVRDLLLGGRPKDFDVATDATPEQVRVLFRNSRLIGRRFRLAHVVFGREIVEVATFRGSEDDGSGERRLVAGRLVRDNVYGSIEEDALRRDFTVNALYYDIADFSVLDAVGGLQDLARRSLRLIGEPEQRYREDPVRILRAVRLAAKLQFEIEASTAAPLVPLSALLGEVSPARLFDEALKLFMSGYGLASFRALDRYRLLSCLLPGVRESLDGAQGDAARRMLEVAFAGTDQRVREGRPVTPGFLFAALLWHPLQRLLEASGKADAEGWDVAVGRVLREQAERMPIPRRFTLAVEEIWALQRRFDERSRKRVSRFLANPRFRAAYDFLLLRAEVSPQLAELATWWTEIQRLEPAQVAVQLSVPAASSGEGRGENAGKRKRPRRRRKPAPAAGGEA